MDSSKCFEDSDDESFHSRFTSEKSIKFSFSFNKRENEKSDNSSPNKRKRLSLNLKSKEINNISLNNNNNNDFDQDFNNDLVLCNNSITFKENGSNDFIPKNNGFIPKNNLSKIDILENDFLDIPSYFPLMSIKLKEIIIGNYNNLNPGSLTLNSSTNSICIELQAGNILDRIDFHVKGIQNYDGNKQQNVIQLNLVHDWIKYLLPVREINTLEEIKIKIDPTGGELRKVGYIKLFLENSANVKDAVNVFGQEFRKMKNTSKPPISPILQWKETKFEVIVNYNRCQRYLFIMEETTLQEFLFIVQKKFNSPNINLPFRYLLDEPEVIHIFNEESWKNFKLASFHRQNQNFKEKKSLVLYLKSGIDMI
ncbi:unnamed protein product [Rhizophagus irregularis]|nr:unnamed protein product [Rhizophagus irregularis]CAB5304523.1 unnamed protein product [Rhizophagus irregularis]